eukprot:1494874-Amphidinium_carterae.1
MHQDTFTDWHRPAVAAVSLIVPCPSLGKGFCIAAAQHKPLMMFNEPRNVVQKQIMDTAQTIAISFVGQESCTDCPYVA